MSPTPNQVTEYDYETVAELRAALTADDAARRSDAYGAVISEDIDPEHVLSDDPPEAALRDAGVVPPQEGLDPDSAAATRKQIVDKLDELIEAVQGGS